MTTTKNYSTNEMLEAALYYALERGWYVFPCRPDKTPHTKNGCLDATIDEPTIREMWERHPAAKLA